MSEGGEPNSAENEEIYKKLKEITQNFNNMSLAHTIAVEEDFQFQPYEEDRSLYSAVRKACHDQFWKILEDQLAQDPPDYSQALSLLQELKMYLTEIISANNTQVRSQVDFVLDSDKIKSQLDRNSLNLEEYADFVIGVMASQCAPSRDETVAELHSFKDRASLLFRKIFETLHVLKVDLINYYIKSMRPHILQNSVNYERSQFAKLFETGDESLAKTKNWLREAVERRPGDSAREILTDAYLDLLHLCRNDSYSLPETLYTDMNRLIYISENTLKLCLYWSIVSLVGSVIPEGDRERKLRGLFEGLITKFSSVLYRVLVEKVEETAELVWQSVNPLLTGETSGEAFRSSLADEIAASGRRRIFSLFFDRVGVYFRERIGGGGDLPRGVLFGRELLALLGTRFSQLMGYNRIVYENWYNEIIRMYKDINK